MKNNLQSRRFLVLCLLAIVAALFLLPAQAVQVFPIVTNATNNIKQPVHCSAFDGTNYLVGFQIHLQPNTNGRVVAQLVSRTGTLIGSQINTGVSGDPPKGIGFDGTNYLLLWAYNGGSSVGQVFGQLISKAGAVTGSPLQVSQSTNVEEMDAVAFAGTNYLVTWTDARRAGSGPGDRDIYGRRVSGSGTPLGGDFKISGAAGADSGVAFDGTNFLVTWRDDVNDTSIYGRLVSPSGSFVSSEFVIDGNAFPSDNPSAVMFAATKYVVAINDQTGGNNTDTWDIFGRFVTTTGSVLTNRFTITAGSGSQQFPRMAFDGTNYLITWWDVSAGTNFSCKARFFDTNGTPASSEFNLFTPQGNKIPLLAPVLFDGTKYFAVNGLEEVVTNGSGGFVGFTNGVVYGAFVPTVATPPRLDNVPPFTNNQFKLHLSGTPGINYAIQAATNLLPTNTVWSSLVTNTATNGTFDFTDASATNSRRLYRAVKP